MLKWFQALALIGLGIMVDRALGSFLGPRVAIAPASAADTTGLFAAAIDPLQARLAGLEQRIAGMQIACSNDLPAASVDAESVVPDVPVKQPSESFASAMSMLRSAHGSGSWSNEDRAALRSQLGSMSDAERAEVLRELGIAINSGSLRVETEGPPL